MCKQEGLNLEIHPSSKEAAIVPALIIQYRGVDGDIQSERLSGQPV